MELNAYVSIFTGSHHSAFLTSREGRAINGRAALFFFRKEGWVLSAGENYSLFSEAPFLSTTKKINWSVSVGCIDFVGQSLAIRGQNLEES